MFSFYLQATSEQQRRVALFQAAEVSPIDGSTPPSSPTSPSESPTSPTDASTASTETSSVKPRRRTGRPRPRPISDYGQLVSRKYPIPEEEAELNAEDRTPNRTLRKDCSGKDRCENGESNENCSINGDINGNRQRPLSTIGVVDLFPPDAEEKEDSLPSVSFYRYGIHQTPRMYRLNVRLCD